MTKVRDVAIPLAPQRQMALVPGPKGATAMPIPDAISSPRNVKYVQVVENDRNDVPAVKGIGKAAEVNLRHLHIPQLDAAALIPDELKREIELLLKASKGCLTRDDIKNALANTSSSVVKSGLQEMLDAFDLADKDKSGKLSKAELKEAAGMQNWLAALMLQNT